MMREAQTDRGFGYDKQTDWESSKSSHIESKTNSSKQCNSMIEEIMYNRSSRITSKENKEYFKRLRDKYNIKQKPRMYQEIKPVKSESLSQFCQIYSNQLESKNSYCKENQPIEQKTGNEERSIGKVTKFNTLHH